MVWDSLSHNWTAIVATYAAGLSTFNLWRETQKGTVKVRVSTERKIVVNPKYLDAYVIQILNQSFFKIEVLSTGFAVFSDPNQKIPSCYYSPEGEISQQPPLPLTVESKSLREYPIDVEQLNQRLYKMNLVGRVKLQPFAKVSNQTILGTPMYIKALGASEPSS